MAEIVSSASTTSRSPRPATGGHDHAVEVVQEALRGLKFGSVVIVVQDGHIVQVERTEKKRL
jgi:hypothetical protein